MPQRKYDDGDVSSELLRLRNQMPEKLALRRFDSGWSVGYWNGNPITHGDYHTATAALYAAEQKNWGKMNVADI